MALLPCPQCGRHRRPEAACPFCSGTRGRAPLAALASGAFAGAALVGGCLAAQVTPVYGPAPVGSSSPGASATATPGAPGPAASPAASEAPASGLVPRPSEAPVMPMYGAPAPEGLR